MVGCDILTFMKQLLLIILFYIIGELSSFFIMLIIPNLLIPGSIIGMLLLLLFLKLKIVKLEWIGSISDFFINNMAFFFVPSVVSLLAYFDIITPVLGKLVIILFISFCVTFIFVGLTTKYILKKLGEKHD